MKAVMVVFQPVGFWVHVVVLVVVERDGEGIAGEEQVGESVEGWKVGWAISRLLIVLA